MWRGDIGAIQALHARARLALQHYIMPSTMAPTKAMARYAVMTLNLPANVMTLLLGCFR